MVPVLLEHWWQSPNPPHNPSSLPRRLPSSQFSPFQPGFLLQLGSLFHLVHPRLRGFLALHQCQKPLITEKEFTPPEVEAEEMQLSFERGKCKLKAGNKPFQSQGLMQRLSMHPAHAIFVSLRAHLCPGMLKNRRSRQPGSLLERSWGICSPGIAFFAMKPQPTAEEKQEGERKLNAVGIEPTFFVLKKKKEKEKN